MQNNPNNPYDDVFNKLAKIVEEIVSNMPEQQHARIVGYTIITRHPGGDPGAFPHGTAGEDEETPYEVVESDEYVFITAVMPANPQHLPTADIRTDQVRICVDDRDTVIMLDNAIDLVHSNYRVHRGLMDITLKKQKKG